MNWAHVKEIINRHRLAYAVTGAICISLLLTVISVTIYVRSGAAQLDLSRPGFASVRSDVIQPGDTPTFSSTGSIDSSSIAQFQALLKQQRATLQQIDGFNSDVMSDKQLNLLPNSSSTTGQ